MIIKRLNAVIIATTLLLSCALSYSQDTGASAVEELVRLVGGDNSVPDTVPSCVLSYITDAYSDHDYHESGGWAPPVRLTGSYSYTPYQGELPEFRMEDFQRPVLGRLTSGYGYRPKFGRFHRGVDIALNSGDTVRCVLPGVVTKTGYEPGGYGRYVVVAHKGGLETLYGHLNIELVKTGYKINAGEALGLGGATGNATGSHLHFETRKRGLPVNPSPLFFNKN